MQHGSSHGAHSGHGGHGGGGQGHGGHGAHSHGAHCSHDGSGMVNPDQASRMGWGTVPGLNTRNFPLAILFSFVVFFFLLIPFIFDINSLMRPKRETQPEIQGQGDVQSAQATQQSDAPYGQQQFSAQPNMQQPYTQQQYSTQQYAGQQYSGQQFAQPYSTGSQQQYYGQLQTLPPGQLHPSRQTYEQRGQKVQVYVNR